MKAEIITIGDELLLGQTLDTNSAWIARELEAIQIHVRQMRSIADDKDAIRAVLSELKGQVDLVIFTGGLGPTKDDITKYTLAEFFNRELLFNTEVMAQVEGIFAASGRVMPEVNRQQAMFPEKAEVLFNDWGTAPGIWLVEQGTRFVFLPGVPFEMEHLMRYRVLPKLAELQSAESYQAIRYLLIVGIGESALAEKISSVEESLPEEVHLAYLPQIGQIRLRINVQASSKKEAEAQADYWQKTIAAASGEHAVSFENQDFAEVITQELSRGGLSLATAESCTGGMLAFRFTQHAGASQAFKGSIIAYSNQVKMQLLDVTEDCLTTYGAVSEQTVKQMAEAAREKLQADYALATSGIAGPTGGTVDKPVGTIWIALASATGTVCKRLSFRDNRVLNMEHTVAACLNLLWEVYCNNKSS